MCIFLRLLVKCLISRRDICLKQDGLIFFKDFLCCSHFLISYSPVDLLFGTGKVGNRRCVIYYVCIFNFVLGFLPWT
jgi:hypothetical protein